MTLLESQEGSGRAAELRLPCSHPRLKGRRLGDRCLPRMLSSSKSAVCSVFRMHIPSPSPLTRGRFLWGDFKPLDTTLAPGGSPQTTHPGRPRCPQHLPAPCQEPCVLERSSKWKQVSPKDPWQTMGLPIFQVQDASTAQQPSETQTATKSDNKRNASHRCLGLEAVHRLPLYNSWF